MKLKTKKLGTHLARRIAASLVAGSLVFCTGSFAFAADANGNNKTVTNENYTGGHANGGFVTSGDASDNTLTVTGVDVDSNYVNGGYVFFEGNTDRNNVIVRNVKNIDILHGGYAQYSSGSASHNTIWIYDSIIRHIHGGHIGSGVANHNKVYFHSGEVADLTGAGYAASGEANFNELYVFGGTLGSKDTSTTQGGYVNGSGYANNNTINIYGGKINGTIYGGYVGGSGEVRNNTINIYGGDLSNAEIYAGYLGGNKNLYGSGNAINFYTKDIFAKQVGGFDNIGFYLPGNVRNGDTILTLTGGSATDWNNASIKVNTAGANLNTGDKINLVTNSDGLNLNIDKVREVSPRQIGTDRNIISYGVARDNYAEFNLEDGNRNLTATVQERVQDLKPQITLLAEPSLSLRGTLDAGTNRILNWLPPEEIETRNIDHTTPFEVFMGSSYESVSIDTGHGSKLRNKSGGSNIGAARAIKNRHGIFLFAPITDYGSATYDTSIGDGTRGGGNSRYFTAGLIARQWNNNGMYYEASFRAGKMRTHFTSDNFHRGNDPTHVSYTDKTPVYTGHVRIGWRGKVSPQNVLDVYGIYSQNHIGSIDANLAIALTGDEQKFKIGSSDSKTIRLGARLTRNVNEYNRFYSGLMYQYQFGGDVLTSFEDTSTPKIGVRGSSGMLELGWQLKPTPNSAVMLDSALVGWVGKQKGFSFQLKLKKDF